jgi:hypothetical protein
MAESFTIDCAATPRAFLEFWGESEAQGSVFEDEAKHLADCSANKTGSKISSHKLLSHSSLPWDRGRWRMLPGPWT